MLGGLTYELKIGRKFLLSDIDDAGNFANASAIHLGVLCEGEEESSVPLELEIYKISVENGPISCERVFKTGLVDSAEKNLRHFKFERCTHNWNGGIFQMSKSKVVFLCGLRQRWLFVENATPRKILIQGYKISGLLKSIFGKILVDGEKS